MYSLSMMEAKLPPGFRFHPKDEELVCDYLVKKISGQKIEASCDFPLVIEVDLNKCEPWDIPDTASVGGKEWYFFSLRDRKYATGLRTNRATVSGYWKATGKDRQITRKGELVGMRKTLVFYQGRAPKGKKTDWVMHEFRVEGRGDPRGFETSNKQDDWVLCRVFYKHRGISSKPMKDTTFHYETSCSSSLPPLLDTFPPSNFEEYEQQVPCFSKTSNFSNYPLMDSYQPTEESCYLSNLQELNSDLNPLSSEKMVKAMFDHLNKMRAGLKMKEESSFMKERLGNFLTDVGSSSTWGGGY